MLGKSAKLPFGKLMKLEVVVFVPGCAYCRFRFLHNSIYWFEEIMECKDCILPQLPCHCQWTHRLHVVCSISLFGSHDFISSIKGDFVCSNDEDNSNHSCQIFELIYDLKWFYNVRGLKTGNSICLIKCASLLKYKEWIQQLRLWRPRARLPLLFSDA